MTSQYSRRALLTTAGLALSSQALAHPWIEFLSDENLLARVKGILQRELNLPSEAETLLPRFVRNLQTRDLHTESPETFARMAKGGKLTQSECEAYVVEEFVVSTNYFAVIAGEETTWRLLA